MLRIVLLVSLLAGVAVVWCARHPRQDASPEPAAVAPPFDIQEDEFRLAPEVARRVWEIETVVHRLQMEVVPKLITAWDGDAFPPFLAADFTATVPAAHETHTHGPVTVAVGKTDKSRTLDAASWFAYLKQQGDPPRAGPSLVAFHIDLLSPKKNGAGWTGTWTVRLHKKNSEYLAKVEVDYARIGMRPAQEEGWIQAVRTVFEQRRTAAHELLPDITASSGIAVRELFDARAHNAGATFFTTYALDYDGDGRLDVLVLDRVSEITARRPGRKCFLYRNRGDGTFEDRTLEAGLIAPPRGKHFRLATVGDFDNDGDDDLLFDLGPEMYGRPAAYRNDGGHFKKTATDLPAVAAGGGCVADYDGDGLLDLYLPNSGAAVEGRDQKARWIGDRTGPAGLLFRGRGGFSFQDVTERSRASGGHREILGANAVDLEPDGDADLVLVNHMGENLVLVNDGTGVFSERPFADPFGGFSMGVATGDLDGDLDPDFYVANMSSRAGRRIMHNLGKEAYPPGVHALLVGWIDGNEILRNDKSGFQVVGRDTAGWAYGPAMVDLDGDGWLDVYCPVGYQSVDPHGPDG